MFERLTPDARAVVVRAQTEAAGLGHETITASHLLLGLLSVEHPAVVQTLSARGVTLAAARSALGALAPAVHDAPASVRFDFTASARSALRHALTASLASSSVDVTPEHILVGLMRTDDEHLVSLLLGFSVTPNDVLSELDDEFDEAPQPPRPPAGDLAGAGVGAPAPSATETGGSVLSRFATDLVASARDGLLDPVSGRDAEIERMVTVLCRRTKNNPVLVGEAGVGKTALVEGLAQRINEGQVPDALLGRSLWSLDLAALVGGTPYRGDFEDRLKKMLAELTTTNAIVFVDEIHSLVGAGSSKTNSAGAGDLLKPALARGQLTLIGATTLDEYRQIEKDPALERRLAPVTVKAPSVEATEAILATLRPAFEAHHRVSISDAALAAAARLSDLYIPDRSLPDKAIDVLDEAGAAASMVRLRLEPELRELYEARADARAARVDAARAEDYAAARTASARELELTAEILTTGDDLGAITEESVARVVATISGVALEMVSSEESTRLLALEEILGARVVGQDRAKSAVAKGVRRRRAGIGSTKRPDSYIFAGPTGVGKTELARALAEALSGDERTLVTLDMSEFAEKHALSRLVGPPPGYVGYGTAGELTEPVRRRPSAVVLLDEVEKAHPDVFNLFLSILEDGRLTDSTGRVVDFSNATLVFTSNLGANAPRGAGFAAASEEASRASLVSATNRALGEHFRPEFLNRIDSTVVFDPLTRDDLTRIVRTMVDRIAVILDARGITLSVTDAAYDLLVTRGYDPTMGARPLRRAVQRLVEDRLSEDLLTGLVRDGDDVLLDARDGVLVVTPVAATALEAPAPVSS